MKDTPNAFSVLNMFARDTDVKGDAIRLKVDVDFIALLASIAKVLIFILSFQLHHLFATQ